MEAIETIEYRGFNIEVHYDEFAGNPRKEFDPLGKIVCVESRNYDLGDESHMDQRTMLFDVLESLGYSTDKMIEDFDCIESDDEFIDKYWAKLEKLAIVLPVDFYDHGSSGCGISVSSSFDDNTTGFIYISKSDARKEYGRLTKNNLAKVVSYLKGEVKEYSSWLNGEVYGYSVEPTDRNKEIESDDSCWGYYGDTEYMISEAKENIKHALKSYKDKVVEAWKAKKEYQTIQYASSFFG